MAHLFVKLLAGQQTCWSHVFGRILRVVECKHPLKARMADIMIEDITILMPLLPFAVRGIEVTVSVWVHDVAFPQQTGQSTL